MTALEEKLQRYRKPSSDTEKDKQERAERMVRRAVDQWSVEQDIPVSFVTKGSYANNTNVRQDSDVDIAVVHGLYHYYNDDLLLESDKIHGEATMRRFEGPNFRNSLASFLKEKFGADCDATGTTAIELAENTGRVKADIVPSYHFRRYRYDDYNNIVFDDAQRVVRTTGEVVINYPSQQLTNGRAKNGRTGTRYKQLVRILKRLENDLSAKGAIDELPSYFMECLVYRVPDGLFNNAGFTPLTDDLKGVLAHIWGATKPGGPAAEWLEPNEIKPLFGTSQKWTVEQARRLAIEAWAECDL